MKIRQQQIFLLLITSVFLTSTLSLLIYKSQKNTLIENSYYQLDAISKAKQIRIEGIIKSRYEMVDFPVNNQWLNENLIKYSETPNLVYQNALHKILARYTKNISEFKRIHLLSPKGIIIASSDSLFINQDWSDYKSFKISKQGQKCLDGFHYDDERLYLFLSSPIYNNDNKLMGIIIIEKEGSDILSILMDSSELGKTGETYLVENNPDKVLFLTPLRHDSSAALRRYLSPEIKETAINRLINEKKHFLLETTDFRGVKVLASGRYIPVSEWGLVAKIDYKEAMMPVHHLRNMLFLFNIGTVFVAFIIAYFAGTLFVKPIEDLIESTNKIKRGDLSTRAKVTTRNEVGVLATSFNKMADRLQQKIEQMENYAYIVSHDLKAPLASIEGLVTIIKEEYKDKSLDSEGKEILEMVDVKIQTMKRLIVDVLKTAKEDSKTIEPVNLADLCQEVLENLNPPAHYHIFIQKKLPVVMYHKISLLQILQNLISNSIKYMNKDQPLIKVGCIEYDRHYKICVTDNGSGISKDKQSRIFEIFEVGHDEEKKDSHGIGLSIVKQLVEEHGGKVWVDSEEGKETSFYFSIPK